MNSEVELELRRLISELSARVERLEEWKERAELQEWVEQSDGEDY